MTTTSELTTDQVAEYLEATCALIESEFKALGDDSSWHFDQKEWCANQVVGHLVEAEKRGFAGRIREILASKEKTSAWDQAAVAEERKDCERMGQSLWMEFMGVRNDSIRCAVDRPLIARAHRHRWPALSIRDCSTMDPSDRITAPLIGSPGALGRYCANGSVQGQ